MINRIYTLIILIGFTYSPLLRAQSSAHIGSQTVPIKSGIESKLFSKNKRIIVQLVKEPATNNQRSSISSNAGLERIGKSFNAIKSEKHSLGSKNENYYYVITYPASADVSKILEQYRQSGEVVYAEEDQIGSAQGVLASAPNDVHYGRQWSLSNNGSFTLAPATVGADIDMERAWLIQQGSSDVIVAVIDGGVKLDHPEFNGRIWTNSGEIPGNLLDDDGNGKVDDVNGWDFVNNDNDPTDDLGHGTNVAGIIGANGNNGVGYAGVDRNCKLMILKGVDEEGYGQYSWWAQAIYYAVDNGAKVINISLGGVTTTTTLHNAINYALTNNVTVVACTGNTNGALQYPSAYPGVIAVGSTNANDTRSEPFFWSATSGSNFGANISVVAPGNFIYGLYYLSDTEYGAYWGGTSQATPHVAGVVALLLAQNPARTPAQIKSIIETSAEDLVGNPAQDISGWDQYYGHGRLNAYNALFQSPLPVRLSRFVASKESKIVVLNWQTTEESNSDYFEVQHSLDAKSWKPLDKVKSDGESASLSNYHYTHHTPSGGLNYYRLKMIDRDGAYAYSRVESIQQDGNVAYVYPNPSSGQVRLDGVDLSGVGMIEVSDIMGKVVYEVIPSQASAYFSDKWINLKSYPGGTYILRVHYKDGSNSKQKFLINK